MQMLELNELLTARSAEKISGDDLEYDPDFASMEQAANGKPEQQYGDTIIPAEPPDWREVATHAQKILDQSHDLRAATLLANALLVQNGIEGFAQAVRLIKGYVDNFWPTVHPELDAEDNNDPTIRVNALMSLCDMGTTMSYLSQTPLVSVRNIGKFSVFDWKVAHGELPWPEESDDPAPQLNLIQAAFQDCDYEELQKMADAAGDALSDVQAIEETVTNHVGAAQSCNFEKLVKELSIIDKVLTEQAAKRAPVEASQPVADDTVASTSPTQSGSDPGPAAGTRMSVANLELTTRSEAIQALDKICEYFERYEPSSPLPLLLKRARRLSNKSFMEIIRDISPDGVRQVESLGGLHENADFGGMNTGMSAESNESPAPPSPDDSY